MRPNLLLCILALIYALPLSITAQPTDRRDANRPRIDSEALQRLVTACIDSHSTSFALTINGEPVLTSQGTNPSHKVPVHSVLKSISALAVGRLLKQGKLDSIDTPVWHYFPEWKQGFRKEVTIRHLLNHTSGIESLESMMADWEDANDKLQIALCSDLISMPGSSFLYNNKAAILLIGVIGRISAMDPEEYFEEELFEPLGISDFDWTFDKAGNPITLNITADELVTIGQLMIQKGKWKGTQFVAKEWVDQLIQPGQPYVENCGLLWWTIPEHTDYIVDGAFITQLEEAEVPEELIEKFVRLKGTYRDVNIPDQRLREVFGENWKEILDHDFYPLFPSRSRREYSSNVLGFKAEGWLGQYIVVYPEKGIVATRTIANSDEYSQGQDELMEFEKLVYEVVK